MTGVSLVVSSSQLLSRRHRLGRYLTYRGCRLSAEQLSKLWITLERYAAMVTKTGVTEPPVYDLVTATERVQT